MNPSAPPFSAGDYRPDGALRAGAVIAPSRHGELAAPPCSAKASYHDHHPVDVCPGFEWLGFPIATALLTMVIGMLFGATIPAAGISGAVLGILLWYAFDRLLDVTLPLGAG